MPTPTEDAARATLSDVATAVAHKHCALFVGAGATVEGGGITWSNLVQELKRQFRYESPLTDEFEVLGDMIHKYGRERVYVAVQMRLRDVKAGPSLTKLAALPWFAAFTTNYDRTLENALVENQKTEVQRVETGLEFPLSGLQSEVLCAKLMGSVDIPFDAPGSMVLSLGDLSLAREQRGRIFQALANHAAHISFLFVGYSFNDGLFLEILERLHVALGEPKEAYYAVFPHAPDDAKLYRLRQLGVIVIIADLPAFANALDKEVALRNPVDFTRVKLSLGHDIVALGASRVAGFLELHNPLLLGDLDTPVSADAFFRGRTDSLRPFALKWQFPRPEVSSVLKAVLREAREDEGPRIVRVTGNPGTGRKFIILAAVRELVDSHRTVALRIPKVTSSPVPTPDLLMSFVDEIRTQCRQAGVKEPERVVIWTDSVPDSNVIHQFRRLAAAPSLDIPVVLLHEALREVGQPQDGVTEAGLYAVNADRELSEDERGNLARYLVATARDHRLPEISVEEAARIVKEERRFLPIIYRLLDPARRSINAIIQEEYAAISNATLRDCVCLCAQASSVNLEIPLAVLRKALQQMQKTPVPYEEVFQLVEDGGRSFLIVTQDIRSNYFVSVYHPVIAEYLIRLVGEGVQDNILECIAQTIELVSRVDAEFASALFISNGVKRLEERQFTPFSQDGLEKGLVILSERQPARPILHHLARFYASQDRNHARVIPLLQQALVEPPEQYALNERKENVLTTLANAMWERDRERLSVRDRKDPDVQSILALLDEARRDPNPRGSHTYEVYVRILNDLWEDKEDTARVKLVNEALEVIDEGLASGIEDPRQLQRLESRRVGVLSELDWKRAEAVAHDLLERDSDGAGYYTLARIEFHKNGNLVKASALLDRALSGRHVPAGAIALKIELLLQDKFPNYDFLGKLVKRLDASADFRDTWKSAFDKGVVYTVNGVPEPAHECFRTSIRLAPPLERPVKLFWMDPITGRRRVLSGRIGGILTEREGRIVPDDLTGWDDGIYFNPRRQNPAFRLRRGALVQFELGFSPRGPQAFEVRPRGAK